MPNSSSENLRNLLSQLQQELEKRQDAVTCPHCGGTLMIVSGAASSAKVVRKPARRGPKAKVARKAQKAKVAPKKKAARRPSELVSLAMQYARAKHNGRIGQAYLAVKKGIAKQAKGKRPEEIRTLKTDWFRQQVAR